MLVGKRVVCPKEDGGHPRGAPGRETGVGPRAFWSALGIADELLVLPLGERWENAKSSIWLGLKATALVVGVSLLLVVMDRVLRPVAWLYCWMRRIRECLPNLRKTGFSCSS